MENGGDFIEVDYATLLSSKPSCFFIETASPLNLLAISMGLISFFAGHLFLFYHSPSLHSSRTAAFPVTKTPSTSSLDFNLNLGHVRALHSFLTLKCSLETDYHAAPLPIAVLTTAISVKQEVVVGSQTQLESFRVPANSSSVFELMALRVQDCDSIRICARVKCRLASVLAVKFEWVFVDPGARQYDRRMRLLLSLFVGCCLFIFRDSFHLDSEAFTHAFVLLVGVAGVLASNPFGWIWPLSREPSVSDFIMPAAFFAMFRSFLVGQLELVRTRGVALHPIVLLLFGLIEGLHAALDATASFERQSHMVKSSIHDPDSFLSELLRDYMDVGHCIVVLCYAFLWGWKGDGANLRRPFHLCVSSGCDYCDIGQPQSVHLSESRNGVYAA
jgi:hypothetical protein